LRPKLIDLGELAARIGRLLSRTLGENIEIKLDLQENLWPVVADPAQMEASIVNIANNARDAMPQGGTLQITVRNSYLDADQAAQPDAIEAGEYVLVEISDNGTGMSREIADQIFQPFFTTKEMGKGTGLGLSMVFGFIKQSNGHINVHSKIGKGTTFWLYLPRAKPSENSAVPAPEPMAIRGGGENILVVEDNSDLRLVVVGQLEELGYSYLEATDAAAAMKILESDAAIDLLFTDVVMPGGMGGFELARAAQKTRPGLKTLLTSGFPDVKANNASSAPDSSRLLTKPYRKADLARALRDVLDE